MRITAVEEYGLRCLLALTRKGPESQMSISEISQEEGLSVPYVSKLMSLLRQANLVKAVRGRTGGFVLSRHPSNITLYDVLTSLGGPLIDPEHCKRYSGQLEQCVHLEDCCMQDVLGGLAGYIQEFLRDTTIEDISFGRTGKFVQRVGSEIIIADSALKNEFNIIEKRASGSAKTE